MVPALASVLPNSPERPLAGIPEWQLRPFTTRQGFDYGLTRGQLYGPAFRTIFRGVLISAAIPDTVVVRARAAKLLLPPQAVFSHQTGGRLLGGPVPDSAFIHASIAGHVRSQVRDLKLHRYTYEPDASWRHGLLVTTPPQTFIHLALTIDPIHVVAFGDNMIRRECMTVDHLHNYLDDWKGQGKEQALWAAHFLREGVDSPPESHLRMLFVLAGLPEPEVNSVTYLEEGRLQRRIELAFRNAPKRARDGKRHLGFEYDSRDWHSSDEQKQHDLERRGALADDGWFISVITGADLYRNTEACLTAARDLMREFGLKVPAQLSDDWRRHFWAPAFAPKGQHVLPPLL